MERDTRQAAEAESVGGPRGSRLPYQRAAYRAIFPPVIALAVLAGLLLWQVSTLLTAARRVEHTDRVISRAFQVLKLLVDMETGQRGYLIGEDRAFLVPYERATGKIRGAFDDLERLVARDERHLTRVRSLRAAHQRWDTYAREEMEARDRLGPSPQWRAYFNQGRGKAMMDDQRALVNEIIEDEERRRAEREEAARRARWLFLAGGALAAPALGCVLAVTTRRALRDLSREFEQVVASEQKTQREADERQRRFLREVLATVTEGRLQLGDEEALLPVPLLPFGERIDLRSETLSVLRRRVEEAASAGDVPPDRAYQLLLAAGEAGMNAVVHAGGGEAQVCGDPERGRVQVWVRDRGRGISEESLHRATLERGFTTAGTLGFGFWMMVNAVDRVWLNTGPDGTIVVLEHGRNPIETLPAWLQADIVPEARSPAPLSRA